MNEPSSTKLQDASCAAEHFTREVEPGETPLALVPSVYTSWGMEEVCYPALR